MSKEKRRVPKLRFPGFTEDWEQRKLSQITVRVTRKNGNQSDLPLTISAQDGLVDQRKYFNRQVASRDMTNYYLIKKGEFAYNKSYSEGYPFGAVKRLDYYDIGALSTLYILFEITDKNISSDFLVSYYMTHLWYKEVSKRAAEGARNHGLLNISTEDFFNSELNIPNSIEEQVKIGNLIKQFDKFITLHQRKLNNLKLKKKALLQKLFPKNEERYPELRFPGFTDAWEQRKFKDIAFKRGKISEADLPYVEFEDINSGIGTLNKNISQKVGHKKGLLFEAGDVLFGKLRPYLQNWLLCQFAGIAVGDFWVLQPQNVSSAFLYYLIQSEAYQSVANISSGTKMPRSSWPLVSETLFSIPKYKEANMIGEFFLLIDRTITLHQRKLDHLQLQKKALLQQMFV
ncbi:restriction endonuclease subunit S [Veillonella parvula]|uniref:restriction endonuclease subunit S n=1 Tax=Veillonella parvula TaxID=29466 RepID=UPI001D063C81|nr:restriction endonuclease subunit S [Veillonella parvula]MCB7451938.1 restriction endonuclease subunit S [Veillonella parvula]